jgi:hypothetical protein
MKVINEKIQEMKTEIDKKVLEVAQRGQELGLKILERAQILRENLNAEELKTMLIDKAIIATDLTRAKLDEMKSKPPGKDKIDIE